MSPQTKTILKQKATLFRDGQHPIYLLPDGRFAVEWGGVWKTFTSLKGATKLVAPENRLSIPIFAARDVHHEHEFKVVDAISFEKKIIDKDGKSHHKNWSQWYVYEQSAAALLIDIAKRREASKAAFDLEEDAVIGGLTSVHEDTFKDIVASRHQEGGAQ